MLYEYLILNFSGVVISFDCTHVPIKTLKKSMPKFKEKCVMLMIFETYLPLWII